MGGRMVGLGGRARARRRAAPRAAGRVARERTRAVRTSPVPPSPPRMHLRLAHPARPTPRARQVGLACAACRRDGDGAPGQRHAGRFPAAGLVDGAHGPRAHPAGDPPPPSPPPPRAAPRRASPRARRACDARARARAGGERRGGRSRGAVQRGVGRRTAARPQHGLARVAAATRGWRVHARRAGRVLRVPPQPVAARLARGTLPAPPRRPDAPPPRRPAAPPPRRPAAPPRV